MRPGKNCSKTLAIRGDLSGPFGCPIGGSLRVNPLQAASGARSGCDSRQMSLYRSRNIKAYSVRQANALPAPGLKSAPGDHCTIRSGWGAISDSGSRRTSGGNSTRHPGRNTSRQRAAGCALPRPKFVPTSYKIVCKTVSGSSQTSKSPIFPGFSLRMGPIRVESVESLCMVSRSRCKTLSAVAFGGNGVFRPSCRRREMSA